MTELRPALQPTGKRLHLVQRDETRTKLVNLRLSVLLRGRVRR